MTQQSAENQSTLSQSEDKLRFALFDDDPIFRAIMVKTAMENNFEIHAYESLMDFGNVGTAGMYGHYDAVILDYDLGNHNGLEISEYLSTVFGDVPMVLLSNYHELPDMKKWPVRVKKFLKKSEGFSLALKQVRDLVQITKAHLKGN